MIFKPITQLKEKAEKNEFMELIKVYIRLVEVYCEKRKIIMPKAVDTEGFIDECKKIGVIKTSTDIEMLRNELKKEYDVFFNAVCYARNNKEEMPRELKALYNSERKLLQQESEKSSKPTLVDFFCGAGGLSLGFIQEGFKVKLANDIEDVCIETYKYNHPELPSEKLIKGDIKEIVDNIQNYISDEIDVVVGGPPCQGFSEANRQRIIDDPRNKLYKYFID